MRCDGGSQYLPIWEKGRLEELDTFQGFDGWYSRGVKFLYKLYYNDQLKSF